MTDKYLVLPIVINISFSFPIIGSCSFHQFPSNGLIIRGTDLVITTPQDTYFNLKVFTHSDDSYEVKIVKTTEKVTILRMDNFDIDSTVDFSVALYSDNQLGPISSPVYAARKNFMNVYGIDHIQGKIIERDNIKDVSFNNLSADTMAGVPVFNEYTQCIGIYLGFRHGFLTNDILLQLLSDI